MLPLASAREAGGDSTATSPRADQPHDGQVQPDESNPAPQVGQTFMIGRATVGNVLNAFVWRRRPQAANPRRFGALCVLDTGGG